MDFKVNCALFDKELYGHKVSDRLRNAYTSSSYAIQTLMNTDHLNGHDECVNATAFNEDGSLALTGSDDETIRVWDFNNRKTIDTLYGHNTNVFSVAFVKGSENGRHVVSGGNDSDVRYFDRQARTSTVFTHHTKKVLRVNPCPDNPNIVMSCSSDGTVRMFDIRQKYEKSYTHQIPTVGNHHDNGEYTILPQMFGGGRAIDRFSRTQKESLVLDFDKDQTRSAASSTSRSSHKKSTICSVEFHPFNTNLFATASSDGTARLFDLRSIKDYSANSYVNIFRNLHMPFPTNNEAMYATFSKDGHELLVSNISDSIYLYDINRNFEQELNLDYLKNHAVQKKKKKKRRASLSSPKQRKRERLSNLNDEDEDEDIQSATTLSDLPVNVNSESEENAGSDNEVDDDDEEENSSSSDEYLNNMSQYQDALQGVLEDYYYDLLDGFVDDNDDSDSDDDGNEEEDELDNNELPEPDIVNTYKQKFNGHIGGRTIKSCDFYGPNSEFVMSGSDDHRIFMWEKSSGKLVRILEAHDNIVNSCIGHPSLPCIISAGLENEVFIWEAEDEYPSKKILKQRQKKLNFLMDAANQTKRNQIIDESEYSYIDSSACAQQ